jgi:hypothetical protein
LEHKLRYKNNQIVRTERLLENLPSEQKPAFESMLEQARADRSYIQAELGDVYCRLDEFKQKA